MRRRRLNFSSDLTHTNRLHDETVARQVATEEGTARERQRKEIQATFKAIGDSFKPQSMRVDMSEVIAERATVLRAVETHIGTIPAGSRVTNVRRHHQPDQYEITWNGTPVIVADKDLN